MQSCTNSDIPWKHLFPRRVTSCSSGKFSHPCFHQLPCFFESPVCYEAAKTPVPCLLAAGAPLARLGKALGAPGASSAAAWSSVPPAPWAALLQGAAGEQRAQEVEAAGGARQQRTDSV